MARFTIYSPTGVALYEGTPTFTGQYMKPGLLEFREVAVPSLIDLTPGCYVDYSRTGYRYRIYTVPQIKKQARSLSYGGAYVYQSVQLYDASKMLEYCPFRDLVLGDNRVHFSTQPSISTFEGCDGLARRFEACLEDQYGTGSWAVRVATVEGDGITEEVADLMAEARDFTVSGINLLQALEKIYEIWPGIGWVYKVENHVDTIIIGGGGTNPNTGTYAYGKGNGLTALTRMAANAEEIANRIYAYGSSRNMLPRWYNSQEIKDADSVDIQNLMIPVSSWGTTSGLPDAAKAFVEDAASIAKNGLRPSTVYFDGKGEYPDIYPSIRETTIGMVRTAIGDSTAKYYPSTAIYTDPAARIDRLLSTQATFDSGLAGDDGRQSTQSEYISVSGYASEAVVANTKIITLTVVGGSDDIKSVTFGPGDEGIRNISMPVSLSGYVQLSGITGATLSAHLHKGHPANAPVAKGEVELSPDPSNPNRYVFVSVNASGAKVNITEGTYYIVVELSVTLEASASALTLSYDYEGGISVSLSYYRAKTFNVALRQVGFDIGAQAELGEGKTIAMRSGKCAGRTFAIKSVQYNSTTDSWSLECWRSEDESLSQWFPNTDYPVRGLENVGQSNEYPGDEFVLLDIAMPDVYISMAEQKLLTAANDLLADTAVERWQYIPEIDAKFMAENGRAILAGEYMALLDIDAGDITPGNLSYFRTSGGGYLLTSNGEKIVVSASSGEVIMVFVDSVVINEGEAVIPTYKVTLRDRKRKTWTESESAPQSTSKPVGNISDVQMSVTATTKTFFTLDEQGNVTLKDEYSNLWVPGWLAAGGIGNGRGGGGGTTSLYSLLEVEGNTSPTQNQVFYFNGSKWTSISLKTIGGNSILGSGDIPVGGGITIDDAIDSTSSNPVMNSVIYAALGGKQNALTAGTGISIVGDTISATGSGSVEVYNLLSTGTRVATIRIGGSGGTVYDILAPTSGGSGSGETDPVFTASAAYGITSSDISAWNGKISGVTMNGNTMPVSSGIVNLGTVLTSHQSVALSTGATPGTMRLTVGGVASSDIPVNGLGSFAYKNSLSASDIPDLSSDYALVTGDPDYYFEVNALVLGDGELSVGTYGSASIRKPRPKWDYVYSDTSTIPPTTRSESQWLAYLSDIPISLKNPYSLTFGSKTYDGSAAKTITAADLGALTSSDLSAYATKTWVQQQGFLTQSSLSSYATQAWVQQQGYLTQHQSLANYVTLDGAQTISGAKTFSSVVTVSGADIVPSTDSTCNIGTSSKRFSDGSIRNLHVTTFDFRDGSSPSTQIGGIYCGGSIMQLQLGSGGANGYYNFGSTTGVFHNGNGTVPCGRSDHRWSKMWSVDADLTGDLSLTQNSHIDIGPLRIEYDATNKALHVTKASSSDQNTYGLYADGFVAAGGTGQTS